MGRDPHGWSRRSVLVLGVGGAAWLAGAPNGLADVGPGARTPSYALLPFAATSPWRLPVADTATFAPDDDPRNLAMADCDVPGQAWVNYDSYSHPISFADRTDPVVTMTDTDRGLSWKERIPVRARIAAGTDAHMHVITPDRKRVIEHWVTKRRRNGSYTCRHRAVVELAGSGIDGGARAYGGSAIGGLIRSWEVREGLVQHPLAIALRVEQMRLGPVWPASSDDNTPDYTGPIPMGSYFAIPPDVDLTDLGLQSRAARVVARACQDYGVYVVDSGGAAALFVQDDGKPATARWHASLVGPDWTAVDVRTIFQALRVITDNTPSALRNRGRDAQGAA